VADGALQYVPFGALPIPQLSMVRDKKSADRNPKLTTDHQPMIIEYEIVNIPSASTLAVLRRELAGRSLAPKMVAVLADPVFDENDPRVGRSRAKAAIKIDKQSVVSKNEDLPKLDQLLRSAAQTGAVDKKQIFARLSFSRQEAAAI